MKRILCAMITLLSVGPLAAKTVVTQKFSDTAGQYLDNYQYQLDKLNQARKQSSLKFAPEDEITNRLAQRKSRKVIIDAHKKAVCILKKLKKSGPDEINRARTTLSNTIDSYYQKMDKIDEQIEKNIAHARRLHSSSYMCKSGDLEGEKSGYQQAIDLLKNLRDNELPKLERIES